MRIRNSEAIFRLRTNPFCKVLIDLFEKVAWFRDGVPNRRPQTAKSFGIRSVFFFLIRFLFYKRKRKRIPKQNNPSDRARMDFSFRSVFVASDEEILNTLIKINEYVFTFFAVYSIM